MAKITGEEDYVYVWTLGVEGMGDGSDKLVTVDVRKGSPTFGKAIKSVSVGGRHEAHHGGFTDDRRQFWAAGLSDSQDLHLRRRERPRRAEARQDHRRLRREERRRRRPARRLCAARPHADPEPVEQGTRPGRAALVEYSNDGDYIATHWLPTDKDPKGAKIEKVADGYGYDARVLPRKNVMLTSSFTGLENYMRPFGELVKDAEAMKKFGQTMVLWDFHARQPKKVLHVPGVPLEMRWAWGPHNNYAFTTTALTSKIWLVYEDEGGEWKAKEVGDIGEPAKGLLPVDISLTADDKTLFVDTFMDGTTRVYDVSDPHKPKQIYEKKIGAQLNMVSQSWDGKRLYFTSLAARELGQDRRRQRAVPQGLRLGRQGAGAALRDRLHGREARAAAHDGVRGGGALHASERVRSGCALRSGGSSRSRCAALPPAAAAHEGHAPPPGAGVRSRYAFPLPAPGSYSLPPIKAAGDGRVLDEDGREQALRQLLLGRVTRRRLHLHALRRPLPGGLARHVAAAGPRREGQARLGAACAS